MLIALLPLTFLLHTCPSRQSEEPAPGDEGTGWSLARLDLEVVVLPEEERLELFGTLVLRLEDARSFGPSIGMNGQRDVMRFVQVHSEPGTEVELAQGYRGLPGVRLAHVRASEPFVRGDELELSFEARSQGSAGQLVVSPEIALASWTESWHPLPIPAVGESLASKAMTVGTTTFTLPAGWMAPCNGELIEREAGEEGVREVWQVKDAVARSFAAGPFHQTLRSTGGRRVRVYRLEAPTGSVDDVDPHAVAAVNAVAAMEARLGPFPYDDFCIVEVPGALVGWYASSQQGHVWATSGVFQAPGGNLPLWGHEMAHSWWGNRVGSQGVGELLCSESLAQYGAVMSIETVDGPEALREFMAFSREGYPELQCARGYFQIWRDGNDAALSSLGAGGWAHQLSDSKGHWVYHMLRHRLGDELFFATLRGLIHDFTNRRLSLDDVRTAFVAVAPEEAEVERFWEQWLDTPGAPILEAEVEGTELVLTQVQPGNPYDLRLEVDLVRSEKSERRTVDVRGRETRVALEDAGGIEEVLLDPRQRILMWRPEYGERP